jgi:hypothetical protein
MIRNSRLVCLALLVFAVALLEFAPPIGVALALPLLLAGILAWCITIWRRAVGRGLKRAYAMINQIYAGTDTSRRNPSVCVSTLLSGQPVIMGAGAHSMNGVALDTAANVANQLPTILFGGSFALTVTAKSSLSPSVNAVINPGDPIYADGGTLDAASNMTTGFTLDANSGGTFYGNLDPTGPALPTGTTAVVTVVLPRGM